MQAKASILIIDDDVRLCEALSDSLEARGYASVSVNDGSKAIEAMRQGHFDLVLIDVMMPGMNGVETLREVKSIDPNVTALLMSGNTTFEGVVSEALWAGVDGMLYKPFDVDTIIEMIEGRGGDGEASSVDLKSFDIDPEVIQLIPEEMARKHDIVPLRVENGTLILAMSDPRDIYAIEDVRARTGLRIRPTNVPKLDILSAINFHYRSMGEIEKQIERIEFTLRPEVEERQRLSADLVAQSPVVRALDLIIAQAVRDAASDIHIEPQEDRLRVRYRIDGILHDAMTLPLGVHAPLLSRIKVLANLNIAERRRSQDGQFSVKVGNKEVDIRVATSNTVRGEMGVLRILDKAMSVLSLSDLGFLPECQKVYERVLHSPYGMILMSGPTGSGKTTTLYASINQLDRNENKIITIEDPIEYQFDDICQMQVNLLANITFASGLRASMRLDPDIMLVGEIRDEETASTAIQAALTGHLVLSSVHASDSVSSVFRLMDLGVEPFLITSALVAVVAQRLVRRVCSHCKTPRKVADEERMAYKEELGEDREEFLYGEGCNLCAQTGYKGRMAVYEILVMSETIRRMVLQGASADDIRVQAVKEGMVLMRTDGMMKAKLGMTTPYEVMRNVFVIK
ncbi:MAG: ATPase, T2SS/T4P/T4SS family [Chloroflexota bacterium]|nr:Flp pilus assembly complex ATPase component TadA [Anaerolineae bacterium]